jgi:hypothetical protein
MDKLNINRQAKDKEKIGQPVYLKGKTLIRDNENNGDIGIDGSS